MKIQLLPSDINGQHSGFSCPFHQAIQRTCPNLRTIFFRVGPDRIDIGTEPINNLNNPPEMTAWIKQYDGLIPKVIEDNIDGLDEFTDIDWGLNNLISVDLPLEEYCE